MKCSTCSNKAVKGRIRCAKCLERDRLYRKKRTRMLKRAGLCTQCARRSGGKYLCSTCKDQRS